MTKADAPCLERDEVVARVRSHRSELSVLGVKSLDLFGSVARGEARVGSDVDVLVEFQSSPSFDQFMDVKFYLEDLLGRRVDLVTPSALKPRMRGVVKRESFGVT
jgi:predicted nucleotidyltransferase